MTGTGMRTGDERVEAFDLVGEAVGDEEFERPVGDRRLRAEPGLAQPVEHLVGPERPVFLQQDFQRLAPDGREAQPVLGAMRLRRGEGRVDAARMVMGLEPDGAGERGVF